MEAFEDYQEKVLKIAHFFKGYANIDIVYDRNGLINLKDSPTDKGREVWEQLYNDRERLE